MSNATSCAAWQLYVIVDRAASGDRDLAEIAAAAIRGGADALQLRDKAASPNTLLAETKRLLAVTRKAGVPLIVNDHPDIARDAGADGVHLGQEDGSTEEARRRLGPGQLIGRSTHSLEQALRAELEGADYIGLGPIFPTPTKPSSEGIGTSMIGEVALRVSIPVVCIGGVDAATLPTVLRAGARCVAVVRAVCRAEDPEAAARLLKQSIRADSRGRL